MITIGVDPGLSGAVAIIRDGKELLDLIDMPVIQSGGGGSKVQKMVDGKQLCKLILSHFYVQYLSNEKPEVEPMYALIERTTAMPGQGVSSMYSMGHSRGVVEGVFGCFERIQEVHLVPAAVWKRHMGYTADKEPIRAEMRRVFPTAELHLKKHADRAEALAMALYLYRQKK